MKKIIGTAAPLSALWSNNKLLQKCAGTTVVGELFLDWLKDNRQHAWQLLPLSETHLEPGSKSRHVPSPYKGYGIGFDPLYLPPEMNDILPSPKEERIFYVQNKKWLEDYALFVALRDHFGTDDWFSWPKAIRNRDDLAIVEWSKKLESSVLAAVHRQWQLNEAFTKLKEHARLAGVLLIGDLPFYLPFRSPLVWAHQDCFDILKTGRMSWVSGIPDGPRSHYGRQVWGHPLYKWNERGNTKNILQLWKMRVGYYSEFYDAMRLDHAKGFFNFGAMRIGKGTKDTVRSGPGRRVLADIIRYAQKRGLELFAEDSGDRLLELRQVLQEFAIPGIRILRWAYNEKRQHLETEYSDVRNYPENCYAFSHTHDTMTLTSYMKALSNKELAHLCTHVGVQKTRSIHLMVDRLKGALIASRAQRVIIPIQDWIYSEERINIPGTEKKRGDQNWQYRCEKPVEKLPKI